MPRALPIREMSRLASGSAAVFSSGATQTAGKTVVDGTATINASKIFSGAGWRGGGRRHDQRRDEQHGRRGDGGQ